jgi:hypothetical protein
VFRLKLVNNVQTTLTTNNLVVRADLFDTCTYFHTDHFSFQEVNDTLLKFDDVNVGRSQNGAAKGSKPYPSVNILRFAIGDSSLTEIVRGQLDRHAVTRY